MWRTCGRSDRETAKRLTEAGESTHHSTIARWRRAEGWAEWADSADGEVAEKIAVEHESAAQRHVREMGALLGSVRSLASAMILDLAERYRKKADVDVEEIERAANVLLRLATAGDKVHDLETLKLDISGSLEVRRAESEASRSSVLAKLRRRRESDEARA